MDDWLDGCPAASLPMRDRGLAYGDGLFETIAVRRGAPTLLERHLARLAGGARRLLLNLDLEAVRHELLAFSAELGEGVAKLVVTRGDGLRGYAPSSGPARRLLMASPLPAYPPAYADHGIELFPCATRLAEQPLLAGLKHLNRLEQVLARAEWSDPRYAEGLMRDRSGRVVECVFSNLFLVRDGQLLTPDLQRCGVQGVMRAALLDLVVAEGMTVQVRDIGLEELAAADEVFTCNSLYGIWPVHACGEHVWSVGPLTRKLQPLAFAQLDC